MVPHTIPIIPADGAKLIRTFVKRVNTVIGDVHEWFDIGEMLQITDRITEIMSTLPVHHFQ